jgi:hypothetical protein
LPALDFLFMLGNTYETEIRFCAVAAGIARIGRGFLFETTLGECGTVSHQP